MSADKDEVTEENIKAKDDVFVFFTTPDYFRLVQEQQQKQGGTSPAATKP